MRFFSDGVTAHRKGDGYAKWNDDEKTKKNASPYKKEDASKFSKSFADDHI